MFKPSKRTVAVTTGIFMLAGGGVAFAYWTQGGSGTGTATTGTTTAIKVNQTSTISGLYPGGSPITLSGNFDNPNTAAVNVGPVTATVTGTSNNGCGAGNFAIGGSTDPGTVPAGNGQGSWTGLTIRMLETGANQDACKDATVNISYEVAAGN